MHSCTDHPHSQSQQHIANHACKPIPLRTVHLGLPVSMLLGEGMGGACVINGWWSGDGWVVAKIGVGGC